MEFGTWIAQLLVAIVVGFVMTTVLIRRAHKQARRRALAEAGMFLVRLEGAQLNAIRAGTPSAIVELPGIQAALRAYRAQFNVDILEPRK